MTESFAVIIKPGAKGSCHKGKDSKGRYIIELKEKAIDNKANSALIKFFKKEFGKRVRIRIGLKSREKVLEEF
jgi:uncharacterized protein (TIGR00251 family)